MFPKKSRKNIKIVIMVNTKTVLKKRFTLKRFFKKEKPHRAGVEPGATG